MAILSAIEPDTHNPDTQQLLPIRAVAQLTGVNPITLRAWERRYGLIRPTRTPAGHRLYSQDDVQRIQQILKLAEQGIGFAQIAQILDESTPNSTQPAEQTPPAPQPSQQNKHTDGNLIERVIQATINLDSRGLREAEITALLWLSPRDYLQDVLIEALARLEMRPAWPDRDIGLSWLGEYIKGRTEWVISAYQNQAGPTITFDFVRYNSVPVRASGLWLICQVLDTRYNLKLLPTGLTEQQRERLVQRWQANLWVRLTESGHHQEDAYPHQHLGTTRLYWCALTPLTAEDEQRNATTPWRDQLAEHIQHCQQQILTETGIPTDSSRGFNH